MIGQYIYNYLTAQSAITSIVSTRVYPEILPPDPTYDAITFRAEAHDFDQTFSGNDGFTRSDYYLDAWSLSHDDAITLSNAIRTTLKNKTGNFDTISLHQIQAISGPITVYETSVDAWRSTQIFTFWHNEG